MARPKDKDLPIRARRMHNMHKSGHSLEQIAEQFGVSRATAARGVRHHKQQIEKKVETLYDANHNKA